MPLLLDKGGVKLVFTLLLYFMFKEIIRVCRTEEIGLKEYKLIFSNGNCDISKLKIESKIEKLLRLIKNKLHNKKVNDSDETIFFYNKINQVVNYMRDNLKIEVIRNDLSKVKACKEYIMCKSHTDLQANSFISLMPLFLSILSIVVNIHQNIMTFNKFDNYSEVKDNIIYNIDFSINVLKILLFIIIAIAVVVLLTKNDLKNYTNQIAYYTYFESELNNLISNIEKKRLPK